MSDQRGAGSLHPLFSGMEAPASDCFLLIARFLSVNVESTRVLLLFLYCLLIYCCMFFWLVKFTWKANGHVALCFVTYVGQSVSLPRCWLHQKWHRGHSCSSAVENLLLTHVVKF